jgi:hypothetical protein
MLLFVLLALSSGAHARDTSKEKAVVIVSVLDGEAFTPADTESLKRYIATILPNHKVINISETTWREYIGPAMDREVTRVRASIKLQIETQVLPKYEITHLILMDHGHTGHNVNKAGQLESSFKFMGSVSSEDADEYFKELFQPMVGKFSKDAFVMLESCETVCDSLDGSQQRMKALMNYFKIPNGTIFGAYQGMVSLGYDVRFHLEHMYSYMKHPGFLFCSFSLGLFSQIPNLSADSSIDVGQTLAVMFGAHIIIPVFMKTFAYLSNKFGSVNWGYLYKMKAGAIEKIYQLHPYKNKDELYLKKDPIKFKTEIYTCNSLFAV